MNVAWHEPSSPQHGDTASSAGRVSSHWPTLLRMALVALFAAVGFILAGPLTEASAAPPPPSPTAGASDEGPARPGIVSRAQWRLLESLAAETLDPHDPQYKTKTAAQVVVKRLIKLAGKGGSVSWGTVPDFVEDAVEIHRRSQQTLDGMKKQVAKAGDKISALKREQGDAVTPAERMRAEEKLKTARREYQQVARELRKLKESRPADTKTQIKQLDADIDKLQNKIRDLEQKADKHPLPSGRQQVLAQIPTLRDELEQARAERDELRGGPDDGSDGTGGTRPAKSGPKNPPAGPGTGAAKPLPAGPVTSGTKTSTTGPAPVRPRLTGPVEPGAKLPRGGGQAAAWAAVGELLGQAYADAEQTNREHEHQELLQEALQDPDLRARILNENRTYTDNSPFEDLVRPFTGPEFTPGTLRDIGPALTELQKTLDTTEAKAAQSNADPLYQQARTDCGGYDTCVTERVGKLRDENAKAVAASTKKAAQSNADPLYQQARTECGGYDTCVTERVGKLRGENAKAVAASTKKAAESNADPLYQQARTECGGYDTCVTERVKKLRDQAAAEKERAAKKKETTTKTRTTREEQPRKQDSQKAGPVQSTKTADAKKGTAETPGAQKESAKEKNAKAVAESTKKAAQSNADPLYQQARTECGGYDTCVTERVKKLRDQAAAEKERAAKKKETTTKTRTTQAR
ncbi:hypothetical protein [Streptomyces sp. NPDC058198]|uniref:hypothetical protein n=1 Tax=Streptomyces sp. NPDC058198 TaxID=3346377 RepID=UPI0036EE65ED